jgi:hypothetical protein
LAGKPTYQVEKDFLNATVKLLIAKCLIILFQEILMLFRSGIKKNLGDDFWFGRLIGIHLERSYLKNDTRLKRRLKLKGEKNARLYFNQDRAFETIR